MIRRICALLGALMVALVVGACGDDNGNGSGDGGEDFVAELNSICEEQTREIIDNNLELGYATEKDAQLESAEALLEIRSEASAQIEELEPPAEDAEAFEDLIAAREDQIAASEDRAAAVEAEDEAAVAEAAEAFDKANDVENKASAELGADVCDEELPQEDAQAAEDVLREFSTTADPATSCDPGGLVTEAFLEGGFGGVEACEKEQEALQKNPDDLPEDIAVDRVTGVDAIAAIIEYEDVGGMFDREPARATLYNLDGGWKIYEIAAVE